MITDPQLSGLLECWKTAPEISPGFRREVWMRIEGRETGRFPLANWIALLARPRFAVAAASLILAAGIVTGSLQARADGEELYLRSVDPLALHSHGR